jgi:hypothetical protein
MSQTVCAFVVLNSDDKRLIPSQDQTLMRAAVTDALPAVSRVVAVMSEAEAALMVTAHLRAMEMVLRHTANAEVLH